MVGLPCALRVTHSYRVSQCLSMAECRLNHHSVLHPMICSLFVRSCHEFFCIFQLCLVSISVMHATCYADHVQSDRNCCIKFSKDSVRKSWNSCRCCRSGTRQARSDSRALEWRSTVVPTAASSYMTLRFRTHSRRWRVGAMSFWSRRVHVTLNTFRSLSWATRSTLATALWAILLLRSLTAVTRVFQMFLIQIACVKSMVTKSVDLNGGDFLAVQTCYGQCIFCYLSYCCICKSHMFQWMSSACLRVCRRSVQDCRLDLCCRNAVLARADPRWCRVWSVKWIAIVFISSVCSVFIISS